MQRQKIYRGTITLGSYAERSSVYGTTTTASMYASHVNWLNACIAEFLSECGVEAVWTNGDWLRIWGLPLLFYNVRNSSYLRVYAPVHGDSLFSVEAAIPGVSTSGTEMCITLYFTGNPTAFYLRFAGYSYLYPMSGACLRVVRGKNVLNNKDCIALCGGVGTSTSQGPGYWYLYDMENGQIASSPLNAYGAPIYNMCGAQHHTENPRVYPMVPMPIGPLYNQSLWMIPANMELPLARTNIEAVQTEVNLGGRKFIITGADNNYSSSYVNMGMIELV